MRHERTGVILATGDRHGEGRLFERQAAFGGGPGKRAGAGDTSADLEDAIPENRRRQELRLWHGVFEPSRR